MPLLKLETTATLAPAKRASLMKQLSKIAAETIGKPEQYMMVAVSQTELLMGGQAGAAAFIDLRSIGGLSANSNRKLTESICDILETELQIPPDRVYIAFTDVPAANWGWNGATFG